MGSRPETDSLVCSFCGKKQDEVEKLIAGPLVFICDECVALCMEILGYRLPKPKKSVPPKSVRPENRAYWRLQMLCLSVGLLKPPQELKERNALVNQGRLSVDESSELSTAIETIRRLLPKISN